MNSLSWLLYGIGVVDGLRGAATVMLVAMGIATFAGTFIALAAVAEGDGPKVVPFIRRAVRWGISITSLAVLILIFVPSRQTMLLIAGSEIGQRVITSEPVQSVVEPGAELLRTWIAEETKRLKGK